MKTFGSSILRRLCLTALSWAILSPPQLHAQFIGYTAPQTVTQNLATNITCTGSPQTFAIKNLGQTEHYLAVGGSQVQVMQARIEGLRNGQTFKMSDTMLPASPGSVGVVFASGFFPQIQATITCLPITATFTAGYTGTSSTPNQDVGDFLLSNNDKLILSGAPANVSTNNFFQTPYGNTGGVIFAQYAGATSAGGTVSITCSGSAVTSNFVLFTANLASNTTGQSFPVPAYPCSFITVSFGNSGAAGVVTVEYVFLKSGFNVGVPSFVSTHVTGTTATSAKGVPGFLHTITINTGGAGTLSVFDLGTAACTGTPATNVIAVITAVATTTQTFTYDVNTSNGICVKTSAAMDFTVSSQ